MGRSAISMLAYGYDLGGGTGEWSFTGTDGLDTTQLDEDLDDDEDLDNQVGFVEQVNEILLDRLAGFTEADRAAANYGQRRQAALDRIGITVATHGYLQEPSYLLAAHVTRADREAPGKIRLAELEQRRIAEGWDDRLATVLTALGIRPRQQRPEWLLAAGSD